MFKTLKYILQASEFLRLQKELRPIAFYSESDSYWPLFQGLIKRILSNSNLNICYLTSDKADQGLEYNHKNYKSFLIDDSYVRNWLFENMQTNVLIMTMPDLNNYQLKRSVYSVHYIYVQHALSSLHMSYRHGAFNFFDTIFCAGPHHVKELSLIEQKYNLPKKIKIEHGYKRLDSIIENNEQLKVKNVSTHALFAPSWGNNAAVESGLGAKLVEKLLSIGCKVTFRPHPETIKSSAKIVNEIISTYSKNELFVYEESISSLNSFYDSDFMISDWSGAALEYSLGLKKPVLFLDLPKKINNPLYKEIDIIPIEISIRQDLGAIVGIDDITHSLIRKLSQRKIDPKKYVYNIGKSDIFGAQYIIDLVDKLNAH
jgi:hypothetical protein